MTRDLFRSLHFLYFYNIFELSKCYTRTMLDFVLLLIFRGICNNDEIQFQYGLLKTLHIEYIFATESCEFNKENISVIFW